MLVHEYLAYAKELLPTADRTAVPVAIKKSSRFLLAQKQQGPMRTMNLDDPQEKAREESLHSSSSSFPT